MPDVIDAGMNLAGPQRHRLLPQPQPERTEVSMPVLLSVRMSTIRSKRFLSASCAGVRKLLVRRGGHRAPPVNGPGRNPPAGLRTRCCGLRVRGILSP